MKLTRHTIRAITALSIVSLAGLLVLQYVLLRDDYDFRQQAFERNVRSAMAQAAQRLETAEAARDVFRVTLTGDRDRHSGATGRMPGRMVVVRIEGDSLQSAAGKEELRGLRHAPHGRENEIVVIGDRNDTLFASGAGHSGGRAEPSADLPPFDRRMPLRVQDKVIYYSVPSPQHVTLRLFDLAGKHDTLLVDSFKAPGAYTARLDQPAFANGEFVLKYWTDSGSYTLHAVNGSFQGSLSDSTALEKRGEIIGRVIDNLSLAERDPLARRIRPALLDSILAGALKDAGIDIPFTYGVLAERSDSIELCRSAAWEGQLRESPYRSRLFPNDVVFNRDQLLLFFPGQQKYLLVQMGPFLGLSALCMGIVVFCFIFTIRTMIRQKSFSIRLVDFINNMTHEFKTPISTIAVAAETIARPDVIGRPEKVLRYTEVIHDENARMKNQVDTILQMAVLEEGDFELRKTDVDLHEIIRQAAETVALQVESKGGTLTCDLRAGRPFLRADPLHLPNIIRNVIDNANKYSPEKPAITVTTADEPDRGRGAGVRIDVTDRGIGIGKEEARRVFEKYYRVPTGNRHDVKGFGLGLSYVKLMTEAHGGSVSIESEPGRGTTVSLVFPSSGPEKSQT